MTEHLRKRTPESCAFLSAFLFGMFTHMFAFTGLLQNHDTLVSIPGEYGAGLTSGRWMLNILGILVDFLFGRYSASWFDGVVIISLLALSAALIVHQLHIRDMALSALFAALLVCFPPVTSLIFFRHTATYYCLSILLAVCAAWMLKKLRPLAAIPLSALLITLSLGIYQSYIPLTIALCVLLLIADALHEGLSVPRLLQRGLAFCAAIALGTAAYFLITKLLLALTGRTLTAYQGISSMGQSTPLQLLRNTAAAFTSFLRIPFSDYYGLTQTPLIGLLWLLSLLLGLAMLGLAVRHMDQKLLRSCALAALLLLLPVAVNFIRVMNADFLYTLMVFPLIAVFCVPLIAYDALARLIPDSVRLLTFFRRALLAVLAALCLNYSYHANVNYTALHYTNQQAQHYFSGMAAQVRQTPGFTADKTWAILGELNDPLITTAWNHTALYGGNKIHDDLLRLPIYACNWLEHYAGIRVPAADSEQILWLRSLPAVQAMPCWPDEGSICIIDDFVVIKWSD